MDVELTKGKWSSFRGVLRSPRWPMIPMMIPGNVLQRPSRKGATTFCDFQVNRVLVNPSNVTQFSVGGSGT